MVRSAAMQPCIPQGGSVPELDPWRPSASRPFSWHHASHLLRRAGFNAPPEEVTAAVQMGLDRTIDVLLAVQPVTLQSKGHASLPNGEHLDLMEDVHSQRAQWLYECVHTPYQLKEKMALFWHDHFSVGTADFNSKHYLVEHINVFRRHGLGKLKDLLMAVTRDPAMLVWLDNADNGRPDSRGQPQINENYAREIFELYTMGAGSGYTQNDIVEAAKCLSGWGLIDPYMNGTFRYRADWHVSGPKWVLGRKIEHGNSGSEGMKDVGALLDTILDHPATAKFLTAKLWHYFVSDDLPKHVHDELANRFRRSGYDIKALMRLMLRSTFFFGPRAMRRLVKNPVEFTVGAMRQTGKTWIGSYKEMGRAIESMGMPLMRYRNPAGQEDGVTWLSSQTLVERMNFACRLTWKSTQYRLETRFDPFREVGRRSLRTAENIVDHYLASMVDYDVRPEVRAFCIEYMNRLDYRREPFTGTRQQIDDKVRGLLRAVMSLPQYQVN